MWERKKIDGGKNDYAVEYSKTTLSLLILSMIIERWKQNHAIEDKRPNAGGHTFFSGLVAVLYQRQHPLLN